MALDDIVGRAVLDDAMTAVGLNLLDQRIVAGRKIHAGPIEGLRHIQSHRNAHGLLQIRIRAVRAGLDEYFLGGGGACLRACVAAARVGYGQAQGRTRLARPVDRGHGQLAGSLGREHHDRLNAQTRAAIDDLHRLRAAGREHVEVLLQWREIWKPARLGITLEAQLHGIADTDRRTVQRGMHRGPRDADDCA